MSVLVLFAVVFFISTGVTVVVERARRGRAVERWSTDQWRVGLHHVAGYHGRHRPSGA